jgi:hypothetical protein
MRWRTVVSEQPEHAVSSRTSDKFSTIESGLYLPELAFQIGNSSLAPLKYLHVGTIR